MVKRGHLLVLTICVAVAGSGCSSLSNTENGALAGGGIGALAGAAIDRRNPVAGAAVGGLLGAGTGALVGHSADEDEKRAKAEAAAAAAPVRGPLTMEEIISMAKAGTPDNLIINQIRASGTRYNLTGETIIWLQQNNVSQAVITEMQSTAYRGPRTVYVRDPVYYGPPPVVGVGIGYGYYRH